VGWGEGGCYKQRAFEVSGEGVILRGWLSD
jgi:hypothetical protein